MLFEIYNSRVGKGKSCYRPEAVKGMLPEIYNSGVGKVGGEGGRPGDQHSSQFAVAGSCVG